jgi:hypothetical protein
MLTHVLPFGAINKQTGEYVYSKIANKKDAYVCPDCNKDLKLCRGKIIRPYFRHDKHNVNPCGRYSNPTETQIHKEGKMIMKYFLEHKIPISFVRNCCSCKKISSLECNKMTETSQIELEYRFVYNGVKIADVAHVDNGEILGIFEICNTHKTCSENRPEPWFEIDADTLIKSADDNSYPVKIQCIRCEKCDDCIKTDKIKNKQLDIYRRKNTRYVTDEINTEKFVYLNIEFSKKDFIKQLGGKWYKDHKLWYIPYDIYNMHENLLVMYRIFWECKDCEEIQNSKKYSDESGFNGCANCFFESINEFRTSKHDY